MRPCTTDTLIHQNKRQGRESPGPVFFLFVWQFVTGHPTLNPSAERMAVKVVSAMLMMTLQVFFFSGLMCGKD